MTPAKKWTAIAAGAIAALLIAASIFAVRLQPWARQIMIDSLRERYKADVEMGELKISLLPSPRVSGENLSLRPHGGAPMIRVRRFAASVLGTKHLGRLTLEGLYVKLPPHRDGTQNDGSRPKDFVKIDEVIADGAHFETTPGDPSKQPLAFEIQKLELRRVGPEDAMTYHAVLTNPKPPGLIDSTGTFGPWNADDPASSVIEGKYTFRNADLGVFKGILGTLQSEGLYKGKLNAIEVHGISDVPDFALKSVGHRIPLHVEFSANVDGADGDTVLRDVQARLGKSAFLVAGSIPRHQTMVFTAHGENANLSDFLTLAMKTPKPAMAGGITFEAKVALPRADEDVIDKLELDGAYTLDQVRFTSADMEQKISSLSHHAEGDPTNRATGTLAQFHGRFRLRQATMYLPDVSFEVPGAKVSLAGTYAMHGGALQFAGTATLAATISQMTTGVKKVLLKPIDPLFRRDKAGAVLPIKISGTPGDPSFGLDIGRALSSK